MFDKAKTHKQPRLCELALDTLLQLSETAMTRKEREAMVDKISATFQPEADHARSKGVEFTIPDAGKQIANSTSLLLKKLSMMIRSMGQRNPTSKLVRA